MRGAGVSSGPEHLFVYGSLRSDVPSDLLPADARDAAGLLARNAANVGHGWVPGALHAIDWYPGLVEGEGQVVGEVWRLPPGSDLLAALDSYESDAYARVRALVTMHDGGRVEAWVYRYVAAFLPANPSVALIASGDYLQWLMMRRA